MSFKAVDQSAKSLVKAIAFKWLVTLVLALGMGLMIEDFESVLNECGCSVTSRTTTTKGKDGKDVTVNPKGLNMLQ